MLLAEVDCPDANAGANVEHSANAGAIGVDWGSAQLVVIGEQVQVVLQVWKFGDNPQWEIPKRTKPLSLLFIVGIVVLCRKTLLFLSRHR